MSGLTDKKVREHINRIRRQVHVDKLAEAVADLLEDVIAPTGEAQGGGDGAGSDPTD